MVMRLPRPGKALLWAMGTLLAIWVVSASAINLFKVDPSFMELFAASSHALRRGEIWRLFTAGLINHPVGVPGVNHIVWVLFGLYFLGPSLEARWGGRRTILFLVGAILMGFASQFAAEAWLPRAASQAISQSYWFGSMAAVEAIAIAWALSNKGQTVYLFLIPVSSTGLLIIVIGMTVLYVIAGAKPPEGLITPFESMLAGYLFGAGSPTPARRLWLKLRYRWISKRAAQYQRKGTASHLRVIEGGESTESRRRPPTDKRFLN
jgi:hypothetical protein